VNTPNTIEFENSVACIEWDNIQRVVVFTWKQPCEGEPLHIALENNIAIAQQHHATKMVVDSRKMGAFKPDDQEWINMSYIPRMDAAGVLQLAFLIPVDTLAIMSQNIILASAAVLSPEKRETHIFTTMQEAFAWLVNP
jgi:hypothetical protein